MAEIELKIVVTVGLCRTKLTVTVQLCRQFSFTHRSEWSV